MYQMKSNITHNYFFSFVQMSFTRNYPLNNVAAGGKYITQEIKSMCCPWEPYALVSREGNRGTLWP